MKLEKNKDNLRQIASLVKYAFLKKDNPSKNKNFMSRYKHSQSFGLLDRDQLTSYVMVNRFKSEVFGHHVPMAGIGYVATFPEYRGRGQIARLMQEILQRLHQKEIPFANLAPFSESFYRHFGFSNTIYQKEYRFTSDALKAFKMPRKGRLVRSNWSDLTVQNGVIQLYERELHTDWERNTMIRQAWWWNRLDSYYPNRNVVVYFDEDGRPVGYLFYRIVDRIFLADEMYSITPRGITSLLAFMRSHAASVKEYRLTLPSDSLLAELFPEQEKLNVRLRPYMMSRIINFGDILACMRPKQEGIFNIQVDQDEQCPWNKGIWQIKNKHHQVTVKKVENELVDYSGSIGAWTQILLGRLTMASAVKLGLLKNYRIKRLDFTKGRVSFYDYF